MPRREPGATELDLALFSLKAYPKSVSHYITATQAVETAQQLVALLDQDRDRIGTLGRATSSALQIHRVLMEHSLATSNWLVEKTGLAPAYYGPT